MPGLPPKLRACEALFFTIEEIGLCGGPPLSSGRGLPTCVSAGFAWEFARPASI